MLKIKSYKNKLVRIFKIIRFVNELDTAFKGVIEIICFINSMDKVFEVVAIMLDKI